MKISIFTATHNSQFLSETYQSIKYQPYDEWVIYPNHGPEISDIPKEIRDDRRTKVVINNAIDELYGNIGAIKKFVCSKCSGDILVELDHDDLLVNNAITYIADTFRDPDVVLAYSNFAEFNHPGYSLRMYDSVYGWKYKDFWWEGKLFKEAVSPELTPYHASLILWAPNHFRAFRRDAYVKVGGYNESMKICDDQDLMCRLYQVGKFKHIDDCCYLYRVHGNNSWLVNNADIQTTMLDVQKQYIRSMVETWARCNNLPMIDLGGRFNCPSGYLSVDIKDSNIVANLNEDFPFEDSSVGVVRAFDVIEHLKDPIHTMSEIHRVLRPGGYTFIEVPSTDGRGAFQDPTHCCYSEDTEVLTLDGFKLFTDLSGDELVYAYDSENEVAVLQPIEKIHIYDYDGDMVHFYGRALDCLVTPNHNMVIGSSDDKSGFRFVPAEDVKLDKSARRIISSVTFDGDMPEYFEIPGSKLTLLRNPNKGFVNDTIKLPIRPFMEFMGWFLSEGWTTINNTERDGGKFNYYRIGISQSEKANPEKFSLIKECIEWLGFSPFKTAGGWCFSSMPFAKWLVTLGKSPVRFIPNIIKQMAPELLEIMLHSLMLGDGSYRGSFGVYATTSSRLASDVQEIAIKCNYRCTVGIEKRIGKQMLINPDYRAKHDMNLVYISKTKNRYVTNKEYITYKGKVCCVTVPKYNIILTRRNGKTIWAGNSFWNQNSFWYYTRWQQAQYIDNTNIRFKPIVLETHFPGGWHRDNNISYVRADLICLKDNYRPMGLIEI